jgi:hypothetical protein
MKSWELKSVRSTVVELMTLLRPGALSITPVNRYIYAHVSSQRLPGATHRADTGCSRSRDRIPGRPVTMPRPDHCLRQTRVFNATNCPTHLRGICCVRTAILNEGGNKCLSLLVHLPLAIPMLNLRNSRPFSQNLGRALRNCMPRQHHNQTIFIQAYFPH